MNTKVTGYLLAVVAAATYGMNPVFAIPLYEEGMNPDSVLLFRYLLAIPLLGAMLRLRGRDFKVSGRETATLVVMGFLVALSSLTLFVSYEYMNAGIASTLLFVYPIMVAVIMAVMFRERMSAVTFAGMALALAGIGVLYKNPSGATLSLVGTALVGLSSLSYAIYIVGVNHTCLRSVATLKVTFYVLLFGVLLFVGRIVSGTELTLPAVWYHWLNLLGLAVFPTAISFLCTTKAIQYIGPTPTAILGALEPVTAIILGVTVLHQPVSGRDWAGIAMIIVAVTFVIVGSKISVPLTRLRRLFPRIGGHKK